MKTYLKHETHPYQQPRTGSSNVEGKPESEAAPKYLWTTPRGKGNQWLGVPQVVIWSGPAFRSSLYTTMFKAAGAYSGSRITLEHSLMHHFGTQPFSHHFGTQNECSLEFQLALGPANCSHNIAVPRVVYYNLHPGWPTIHKICPYKMHCFFWSTYVLWIK